MGSLPTIRDIQFSFKLNKLNSIDLTNQCLQTIQTPDGEGSRAFIEVLEDQARKSAKLASQYYDLKSSTSPLLGIPISIKDLFDINGQSTRAGSVVLKDVEPVKKNATVIERLLQAGALLIGRTTMTEFAYSGVGLNPHYGTPASPYERNIRRIPGGSSSGSGVSVADQMAVASIGTDTGGSVRIPAALCGIVGFKPTARRVPTEGVYPLSSTFDSVGPLAPSVQCCIVLDQIMSNTAVRQLHSYPLKNLRVAIPGGLTLDSLDSHVTNSFERSIQALEKAGALLQEIHIEAFESPNRPSSGARLLAAEAYAIHRSLLDKHSTEYDPRVATRIQPASETSAADYIDLLNWRKSFVHSVSEDLYTYDVLLMPTTPTIAPPISALEESDDVYFNTNKLMLRNTCLVNQMDGCALSIPCHKPGEPPMGIMLAGLSMQDEKILQIGLAVEAILNQQ